MWLQGANHVAHGVPRMSLTVTVAVTEQVLSTLRVVRPRDARAPRHRDCRQHSPAGLSSRYQSGFSLKQRELLAPLWLEESCKGGLRTSQAAFTERSWGEGTESDGHEESDDLAVAPWSAPVRVGAVLPSPCQPWGRGWTHGAENVPTGAEPGRQRSHGTHQNISGPTTVSTREERPVKAQAPPAATRNTFRAVPLNRTCASSRPSSFELRAPVFPTSWCKRSRGAHSRLPGRKGQGFPARLRWAEGSGSQSCRDSIPRGECAPGRSVPGTLAQGSHPRRCSSRG